MIRLGMQQYDVQQLIQIIQDEANKEQESKRELSI